MAKSPIVSVLNGYDRRSIGRANELARSRSHLKF
jgi:hypothetical protein